MVRTLKPIPTFADEAEERRFWESHDSTAYLDWSKAQRVRMPNLKPTQTAISLRLPMPLLERIKVAANKRHDIDPRMIDRSTDRNTIDTILFGWDSV